MDTNQTSKRPFRIQHWQKIALLLMLYDALMVNASYFLALLVRHDFHYTAINQIYIETWEKFAPIYALLCIAIFMLMGLYRSIWRFASFNEFGKTLLASTLASAFHVGITLAFYARMPISYYLFGAILQFALVLGIRFSYRVFLALSSIVAKNTKDRIMLIGAGAAGQMILRDLNDDPGKGKVVCIIDDNANKWGRYVDNVRVVGGGNPSSKTLKNTRSTRSILPSPAPP